MNESNLQLRVIVYELLIDPYVGRIELRRITRGGKDKWIIKNTSGFTLSTIPDEFNKLTFGIGDISPESMWSHPDEAFVFWAKNRSRIIATQKDRIAYQRLSYEPGIVNNV